MKKNKELKKSKEFWKQRSFFWSNKYGVTEVEANLWNVRALYAKQKYHELEAENKQLRIQLFSLTCYECGNRLRSFYCPTCGKPRSKIISRTQKKEGEEEKPTYEQLKQLTVQQAKVIGNLQIQVVRLEAVEAEYKRLNLIINDMVTQFFKDRPPGWSYFEGRIGN